jgi:pimeloyl-ACP methyl ester carboxylesterase
MRFLASLLILATTSASAKPAIVLVHGAFADASSWSKVIPILQKDGYYVTAVQIPLTSLEDDVAVTRRVIAAQKGPVVVVGHSYAGAVITDAADGDNVKSLVYIDAFAPEAGEPLASAGDKFAAPPLNTALVPDAAGFLYVDRAKVHDVFAKDMPEADANIIAVTQKPVNSSVFGAKVTSAAWKTKPSWFIIGTEDRAINPDLLRFYAKRIGAKTTEIKGSSHVPFLSHPKEVVRVIESAAE